MSTARIEPGPLYGTVRAPPSKSYTHRALVVGHLSGRRFSVRVPLDSDDTRATARAISRLGSRIRRTRTLWEVRPSEAGDRREPVRIDCGESGTTLRFAVSLAARLERAVTFTGSRRLSERPLAGLLRTLRDFGAGFRRTGAAGLPIEIHGPIHGARASLDASKSSQFASSLLLVLPTLADGSRLELTGEIVSQPYLDATLAIVRHHGVRVTRRGRLFSVPGSQRYEGEGFRVPGDASSAAYFWAAAAISGGRVRVEGIPGDWPQADVAILPILRRNGSVVDQDSQGATVTAGPRRPFRVDLTDAPDLYPLAGVLAATTEGVSRLEGAGHVVLKESDRKQATATLARRLGAKVAVSRTGLRIEGTPRPRPLRLPGISDHRLLMSAAVGALAAISPSELGERDAVRKSFPEFWSMLASLGAGTSRT